MWTCPACGASNEPHAIFCAACGAMKVKAPPREPRPHVPVEPLTPSPPQFQGTLAGFVFRWIGVTLAGAGIAWIIESAFFHGLFAGLYQRMGELAIRAVTGTLSALVYAGLIGIFQAAALRRSVSCGPWIGWAWAMLAGGLLASWVYLLLPQRAWSSLSLSDWALAAALSGLAGGALAGVLQARVLLRRLGPPGWTLGWALLSAAASALGNITSMVLWQAWQGHMTRFGHSMGLYYLAGLADTLAHGTVTAFLTGLPLGLWLRRRAPGRAERQAP